MSKKPSEKDKQPNEHLRRERQIRCWRLQDVADRLYALCVQDDADCALIAPDTVGRWERGYNIPSAYYQQKLCLLFSKNATELGLLSTPPDGGPPASQQEAVAEDPSKLSLLETLLKENKEATILVIIQKGEVSTVRIPRMQEGVTIGSPEQAQENEEMNEIPTRRELLGVGAELGATALLPHVLTADEAERLSWLFADAKALDATALSSLERITDNYWHLLHSGVPKAGLLQGVLGHLATIKQLLHTAQPTAFEQRLSALVSQQAQMAGSIYFDMRDYAQAEQYFQLGIEVARHTANPPLYAVAVARTSFVYRYSHQFQEALCLLRVARRYAEQSPTIYYWIAGVEAEVHARLYALQPEPSIAHACLETLEEAERSIEQLDEAPSYGRKFGLGDLLGYKGVCFRYLRRANDAQAVLLEALTTLNSYPIGQAMALVDLGSVYAQQGEIEEACTRATQALMLISQTRSANTLQRVSNFRRELEPWASRAEVQTLDEQIMLVRLGLTSPTKKYAGL
jgi:tetratricopeptide (TPR) repeat protein